MSRSKRPSKSYRLQHKRSWIHEKQLGIQQRAPRVVQETVMQGVVDHREDLRSGIHMPSDDCFCLGCED